MLQNLNFTVSCTRMVAKVRRTQQSNFIILLRCRAVRFSRYRGRSLGEYKGQYELPSIIYDPRLKPKNDWNRAQYRRR
jgi:hypothetical protein